MKGRSLSNHADDELIGAHATISLSNSTWLMFYAGLLGYDYDNEEIKKIRLAEYKRYCALMGTTYIDNDYSKSWVDNLREIVLTEKPDAIFIPSIVDWHWQHREVAINAIRLVDELQYDTDLYMYQVTVPLAEKAINSFCILDEKAERAKWNTFISCYESQSFMPIERLKAAGNEFTKEGERVAAEPFCLIEREQIRKIMENYDITLYDDLNALKDYINDLNAIRLKSEELYRNVFNV